MPAPLPVSGFTDGSVAEHAEECQVPGTFTSSPAACPNSTWTSATPTLGGNPVGTVSWAFQARDEGLSIDRATGVVTLADEDYEHPRDGDGDNVYEATVIGYDSNGNYAAASFSVTVTNVIEVHSLAIEGVSDRKHPLRGRARRERPTTDLGYEILVTDTATGAEKTYANEPGTPAPAITDVKAFAGACTP